jgi:hypothetical protein
MVDVSTVLNPGDSFEIRYAMALQASPVASGRYQGGSVALITYGPGDPQATGWSKNLPGGNPQELIMYVLSVPTPLPPQGTPPSGGTSFDSVRILPGYPATATLAPNQTCSWAAQIFGGTSPFNYSWSSDVHGSLGADETEELDIGGMSFTLTLVVTDADNVSRSKQLAVPIAHNGSNACS